MNKKHLIKILKTEIGILTDLINEIPDSGDIHPIEIDLTLSKTKDIYNELLLLKGNDKSSAVTPKEEAPEKPEKEEKPDTQPEPVKEETKVEEEKTEQENTDEEAKAPPAKKEDSASEQSQGLKIKSTISTLKPKKDLLVNKAVVDKEESNKPEEQPTKQPKNEPEKQPDKKQAQTSKELSATSEPTAVEAPENTVSQKTESEPEADVEKTTPEKEQKVKPEKSTEQIIADKFQNHSPSVNEMLASFKKDKDLATRLKDSPISDLKKAIKINDRIWFINELFNKDARLYDETLSQINSAANLDEALKLVFDHFNWDQNKKSTISFLELLYRRFAV